MGPENLSQGHESQELDATLLLQESLGVDADAARDLASIQVACPDPRGEGSQTSLGKFIASSHGTAKTEQIIDTVREEIQDGTGLEKAMQRALGVAAVKDQETGKLLRVNEQPETSDQPANEAIEKERNDEDLSESMRETSINKSSDEAVSKRDTELSPEEQAALHEEPEAEPAETEPAAEAKEIQAEPPQDRRIDEAIICEHEFEQDLVDTAAVPPAKAPEQAIGLGIPEAESLVATVVDTSVQEPKAKVATLAPKTQLKSKEIPAPTLIIRASDLETTIQPLEPVKVKSGEDFQPIIEGEPASNPSIEVSEETLAVPAQPEEALSLIVPVATETLEPETPAQKLVFNLEEILIPEAEGTETADVFQIGPEITPKTREVAQKVSEALQLPGIDEAENVQVAVANIAATAEHAQELLDAGEDATEAKELVLSACVRLLDELGIEYDEETAMQFARLVLAAQAPKPAREEELIIENPIKDEGTHEFKPGQLRVPKLAARAKQKFPSLRQLGKYALANSLATA